MRLEMGPELQAARGVLPKQKFWKALGRLSRSSPSQSTFFIPMGHCPRSLASGCFRENAQLLNSDGGWRLAVTVLSVLCPSRALIAAIPEPFRPMG
jgi:hypothetical protein